MDSQKPYRKPDLMEIIDKYLKEKEIDKSQKYDQYSYKSSDEISKSTEKLKEWLEKTDKILEHNKHCKQYVKSSISELEASLYKKIIETQEKIGTSKIERAHTLIDLKCLEFDDLSLLCKHNIDVLLHIKENKVIICYTGWDDSPDNFGCTRDGYKPLFYFEDSSFIKSVKDPLLSAFDMLRFGKLLIDYSPEYRVILIKTDVSMNPSIPPKANPEMKIDKNSINFYNDRSKIEITFDFDVFNRSYLKYFKLLRL
jgi:hypothetical protein